MNYKPYSRYIDGLQLLLLSYFFLAFLAEGANGPKKIQIRPFKAELRVDLSGYQIQSPKMRLFCEAREISGHHDDRRSISREVERQLNVEFELIDDLNLLGEFGTNFDRNYDILKISNLQNAELMNPFYSKSWFERSKFELQKCSLELKFYLQCGQVLVPVGIPFSIKDNRFDVTDDVKSVLVQSAFIFEKSERNSQEVMIPYWVSKNTLKTPVGPACSVEQGEELFPL